MCEACEWGDVLYKVDPMVLDDGTIVHNVPPDMDDIDLVMDTILKLKEEIREEKDPTGSKRLIAEFEKKMATTYRKFIYKAAAYIGTADELVLSSDDITLQRLTITDIEIYLEGLTLELIDSFSPEVKRYLGLMAAKGALDSGQEMLKIGVEPPGNAEEFPGWGNHPVDQTVLDAMVGMTGRDIKKLTNDVKSDIIRIVQDGIRNNQHPNVVARDIRDSAKIPLNRARTIARTESINTFNQAAEARYKSYGIEEFIIVIASDDRTCIICQLEASGGPYKFSEGGHRPTFHPNCRCKIAPLPPGKAS